MSRRHRSGIIAALLLSVAALAAGDVPSAERDALIALYNATAGASWSKNTGWLGAAGTECDWFGIRCNDERSSVIEIALEENNLTGSLPTRIGSFPALRSLYLWRNALSGALPSELGQLTNLEELLLNDNGFTGAIPSSISALTKLRIFAARSNKLTSIPREIGSATALEELTLSDNQFSGAIPSEIGNLTHLTMLDLAANRFTGSIPDSFAALANLEYFTLEDNQCSGSLPSWLGNLASLLDLRLSYNQFTGTLPAQIGSLRNLQTLDLSSNQLNGALPAQLGDLASLERLWLNENQFSGAIPPELTRLTNLVDLVIENNQLTGTIPPELAKLPKLAIIWLSGNQLTGTLPAELTQMPQLQTLGLYANQLSGTLPPRLLQMPALKELDLSGNQFTGAIPSTIDAPNLESLSLSGNQLTGSIPTQLGTLTNLRGLDLSRNKLTGSIPSELSKLTKLGELHLQENRLTGSIPAVLGEMTSLEVLALDLNELSGSIPAQLFSLPNLTVLDLRTNALSGSIPSDVSNLRKVEYLLLSENQLTGSIPAEIGRLTQLIELHVQANSLSGSVPVELWQLPNLELLLLSDNQLSGTVAPDISGMKKLLVLELGRNRFGGALPPELGSLSALQELDISANQFRGAVPSQMANLTNLVDARSDFSNNALYTSDTALSAFLTRKEGGPWYETQTVAPTSVAVADVTDRSAVVSWKPVDYDYDEGGYQVTATPRNGGSPIVSTTPWKDYASLLVRSLQPATQYDFVVRTVTHPHSSQQNLLVSDPTTAVTATTTAKVNAPADVELTATTAGLVQVDGFAQNEDAFVLSNFGDLPASISLRKDGSFFDISPTSFTLAGGASQTVTVKSIASQPPGTYDGSVVVPRDGDQEEISIDIRLLSVQKPSGRAVAEAETTRVEIVGDSGSDSVGSAAFRNRGNAPVIGMLVTDVPWLTTAQDLVTIDPGSSYTANFTIVRSKRPDAGAANGTVSGSLQLVYVDGSSATASLMSYKPTGTTPTPGLSVTIVTVVDTVKPSVSASGIPANTPGEVVRFIAGISTFSRPAEQFASDLSIANVFGTRPVDDLRMYFTSVGSAASVLASFGAIAPSRAVTVANVAKGVYAAASQVGTLQIRSRDWDRLLMHARMTNRPTGAGTTGTALPVFRSDRAVRAGGRVNLPGVRRSASEHTNLYVQETAGAAASIQIEFLDATGAAVGAARPADSLAAYALLELANGVPAGAVTVVVTNRTGSAGSVVAYAVVVDEKSSDTWTIVDWNAYYDFAATGIARVPFVESASASTTTPSRRRSVVHATTVQNTTDLTLFNPGTSAASLRLQYRDANDVTAEQTVTLAARETRTIADAAKSLSSAAGATPGYITIEPLRGTFTASSRTYQTTSQGTLGTTAPLLAASSGLRLGQKQTFSSVDDSAGSGTPAPGTQRTAIGLLEMSGSAATVRATLLLADGKSPFSVTVSRDFSLRANQLLFVDSIAAALAAPFAAASWGDLHDLQIEFEVVAGSGAATPFLLVTNSDTGDTMLRLE